MSDPRPSAFSLSALSIRQHIGTLMLTLTVVVMGFFAISQLQVDLLPSITYPRVGVEVDAPGIAPEVAIDEITRPLEEGLLATEGVEQIFSRTQEGRVRIDMFFRPGGNVDRALNDATAAYNRARNRLPDGVEEPRIFKFDPSQLPIYEMALTSPSLSPVELRVFADEELGRELRLIPGVAAVDVSGGVQEEVRVTIDLNRLQALGVGLTDVLDELEVRNEDVSGGRLRGGNVEALTRTLGRFQDASEIRDLSFEIEPPPASQTPSPNQPSNAASMEPMRRVYLRDFAQVEDGAEEQRLFVSLNGQPAVRVSVQKQPDANTIVVTDGIKQRLELLKQQGLISQDMTLIPTLDESRFIRNSLSNLTWSGIFGAVLAVLSVVLFLGSLRQTLIIALTIPLCTLFALILMQVLGLTLNVFSLAGLAIGVGQVVDASVVILENITRRVTLQKLATGGSLPSEEVIDTAIVASREVESSLVASTATNLVSVLPFFLIGGFFSLLFGELILTISFAIAASLLMAVTVVPMLAARLLTYSWSSRISEFWLLHQFSLRFEGGKRRYAQWLVVILRYRWVTLLATFLVLGGSGLVMAGQLPQEVLPRINTGQASLFAQFPPGLPLETSRKVMGLVDDILLKQPETEYAFSTVGGALFGRTTTQNPLRGSSTVILKPGTKVDAYVAKVSAQFSKLNLAGIRLRISPGQVRGLILNNSPVVRAELDVLLQGDNSQVLAQATRQVLSALDDQVTQASFRPDSDPRQPEVQIRPDWERAKLLGLTAREIGETIRTAVEGSVPTQLQRGNRLVDIRVRLDLDEVQRSSQLEQLPLFIENNRQVRLSDVATIGKGQAPSEIQRINQRQVSILVGNLSEGASLSTALAQVKQVLSQVDLPDGVRVLPSSIAQTNQQLQAALKVLGVLAAFLVFVVMAVQYNSLVDPLVIMLTVPLGLAGGILGLFVTGTAIGATVLVGAVLLVGIVVNNAIIMVETANQIREQEGVDRQTAILKAAPQRLRPILMTAITTVLGVLPLALGLGEGSEFMRPLGVVVFFGLSLATLLTMVIIPCFYTLLHELFHADFWSKQFSRLRSGKKGIPFM